MVGAAIAEERGRWIGRDKLAVAVGSVVGAAIAEESQSTTRAFVGVQTGTDSH